MDKGKIVVAAIAASFLCGSAWSAEVSSAQAETFANVWSSVRARRMPGECRERRRVSLRTICTKSDRPLFHVANLPEGGFVVMSGDTALSPVVAYSDVGAFVEMEGNPVYEALLADMSARIAAVDSSNRQTAKWPNVERIAKAKAMASIGEDGLDGVSDIRVAPITKAKWSQLTLGGRNAFNMYTPNNYSCGCVAAAFLAVMRHWCEPRGPVAQSMMVCWIDGVRTSLQMMGGTYDWASMPLEWSNEVTDVQLREIGRAAYDVSLAMHTSYYQSGSQSCGELGAQALATGFGYASVRVYDTINAALASKNLIDSENYRNAILASLDAGMPVVVGVQNESVGHQLVIDGYGFSAGNVLFCHLNCGWGGMCDLWYNVMAGGVIDPYWFTVVEDVVYNIHPRVSGDVISGRVLDDNGVPVPGVSVKLSKGDSSEATTTTDAKGIFSFRFSGKGTFTLEAADPTLGSAKRRVVIGAEGKDPEFEFDDLTNSSWLYSDGVVANRWGQDLVLTPPEDGGDDSFDEQPFDAANAGVFDGCILADTEIKGTIQVKAGKAKNGESKVTATVILADSPKKLSFKGVLRTDTGFATLSCAREEDMSIYLGKARFSGEMANGFRVSGVRNLFLSKDKAEVNAAEGVLAPKIGTLNVVGDNLVMAVSIGKKGKVKVSGTYRGVKVSASVQAYVGDGGSVLVPVVVSKKGSLAFLLTVGDSTASIAGLGDDIKVGKQGRLQSGAVLQLPDGAFASISGLLVDLLPDNEPLTVSNGKWDTAKAAKVTYKNGVLEITPAVKGGNVENPSGLKLSYKAKDGSFKGSFKVYAVASGKLQKYTANVAGVLVDGIGYGTAEIKKVASCPVVISEP